LYSKRLIANLVMSYSNISASYSDLSVHKLNRNSKFPTSAAATLVRAPA